MKAGLFLSLLLASGGATHAGSVRTDVLDAPDTTQVHLIYLHGRIIENAGPRPTDPRFGLYDYPAVLDALSARGAVVISAPRPPGTDMAAYAGVVVSQVESLIARGVPPGRIAVVGFSKGGGIATRVSSYLRRPEVRFVLLAACLGGPVPSHLRLTGRVLSIHETSDDLAGSCAPLARQPEPPRVFEEIEINTGKQHGAFYQPLPAWIDPALDWIHDGGRPDAAATEPTSE